MVNRIIFILSVMVFFSFRFNQELHKLCQTTEKKHGSFSLIITNPQKGNILFVYKKRKLYHKKYCPGSLIKPFTLITYRKDFSLNKNKKYFCKGFKEYSHNKICWYKPGHGNINIVQALAFSCNKFFYYTIIKNRLNMSKFLKTLDEFNIKTDISKRPLSKDQFYKTAVGLDYHLRIRPIDILNAYNSFYNNGNVFNKNGNIIAHVNLYDDVMEVIQEGMRGCYLYGTAKKIYWKLNREDVLAKTGTGSALKNGRLDWRNTVGWVIVFLPSMKPFISLMVLHENGIGSEKASMVASEILEYLLKKI